MGGGTRPTPGLVASLCPPPPLLNNPGYAVAEYMYAQASYYGVNILLALVFMIVKIDDPIPDQQSNKPNHYCDVVFSTFIAFSACVFCWGKKESN